MFDQLLMEMHCVCVNVYTVSVNKIINMILHVHVLMIYVHKMAPFIRALKGS